MKGRYLLIVAVAVYLAVVGCVVWPQGPEQGEAFDSLPYPSNAPRAKLEGLPFRGLAIQIQDPREMERYRHAVDQIAATGADTVEFVVSARQENGSSARIFLDLRRTPTSDQITELVARAKQNKLRVVLMPIVLLDAPQGNDWRGTIEPKLLKPDDRGTSAWEEWFESYREMMVFYADLAQKSKVDVLSVGSELVSSESHGSEWGRTIRQIRGAFHGSLVYSSNWDHYENIPFWDQLDIIGMNSYWLMGKDHNVTVEAVVARWREIQKDLMAFSNKKGKPILLMEVGWCSMANAAHEPWDYTKSEIDVPLDLDLQRKLYEGFFQAWYGNPNMAGFMIWEWEPYGGGVHNRSYTPEGKPAEKVLRQWLAKGPWEVK